MFDTNIPCLQDVLFVKIVVRGMSNVLPQEARAQILRITRLRVLLLGALVLSITAVIAILAVLPAFLSIALPLLNTPDTNPAQEEQAKLQEVDRESASRTRTLLASLAPFAGERASVSVVIARVYELRPPDVTIEKIAYEMGTKGSITITGSSDSRESVNDFRTALVDEGAFEGVSVPVAALVGALSGNFTITLTGKF